VPVGAFSIDAMVAEGRIKGVAEKASGFGLVVRYDLSRRTDLYFGHRSNRDDNSPTTGATVRSARVKDTLTGVGIRHRF
jgi:predicted porin